MSAAVPAPAPVAAAVAAPVAAAPVAPPAAPAADTVVEQVLGVVAEKTGYPKDMLELDLDMEADLGIDTVKQAETFAAIRETFAIPVQEGINLRDYPTLKSVVDFVKKMRPDLAAVAATAWQPRLQPRQQLRQPPPRQWPHLLHRRRSGRREGAGSRGRQDRLPQGHARTGPGPGSRPGHRHGQAGRDLRLHSRVVRHPGAGRPEPA